MIELNSTVTFKRSDVSLDLLKRLKDAYTLVLPFSRDTYALYDYDKATEVYRFPWSAHKYFLDSCRVNVTGGTREIPSDAPRFVARDGQGLAIQRIIDFLKAGGQERGFAGGILCAGCGQGKTIMSSKIILDMGIPTCVVVHKEFLEEQWQVALRDTLGSTVSIGKFRGNKSATGYSHDVVIASTQTLTSTRRVISDEFLRSFGLLVLDEVHRYGADVWQTVIWKFPTKYRLGLTATPDRLDGMWPVIVSNIGPIAYELDAEAIDNSVYLVKVDTEIDREDWDHSWRTKIQKRAALLSLLAENEGRNLVILKHILAAYEKGRKILVITDRKVQIEILTSYAIAKGVAEDSIGHFLGGMKKADKQMALTKQLIFTTYAMSKEGLDMPSLDTMFFGTPQSDIRQALGRLLRDCVGKSHPIAVDFIDSSIPELVSQAFSRLRHYREIGCTVYGNIQ